MASNYKPEYTINFSSVGDMTKQAIKKACIDEIARIYIILSSLSVKVGNAAGLQIKSNYTGISQLPVTGVTGQVVSVTTSAGVTLYAWNGTAWVPLNSVPYALASGEDAGFTVLANKEDILAGTAYTPPRAVAEKTLVDVVAANGSGFTPGTIIMWYGEAGETPSGWVFCDGSLGSPDLRGAFIKGSASAVGETGGDDEVEVEISCVPAHTHTYNVNLPLAAHTHPFSGSDVPINTTHGHGSKTATSTLSYNGAHTHQNTFMSSLIAATQSKSGTTADEPLYSLTTVTSTGYADSHVHNYTITASTTGGTGGSDAHQHTMNSTTTNTESVAGGATTLNTLPYEEPATKVMVPTKPINMALMFLMKV